MFLTLDKRGHLPIVMILDRSWMLQAISLIWHMVQTGATRKSQTDANLSTQHLSSIVTCQVKVRYHSGRQTLAHPSFVIILAKG